MYQIEIEKISNYYITCFMDRQIYSIESLVYCCRIYNDYDNGIDYCDFSIEETKDFIRELNYYFDHNPMSHRKKLWA
jgi:hypothetical protein